MKTVNELYFSDEDVTFEIKADGSLMIFGSDSYCYHIDKPNFSKLAAFFEESALKLGDMKNTQS